MKKILKYTVYDLIRSRWSLIYLVFYLLLGFTLLFLNEDIEKSIITIMNVVINLTPLIATILGIMYFYNSREFVELLLAQPLKRRSIFLGQYLGLSLSLSLSFVLGLGLPFVFYGLFMSSQILEFVILLFIGTVLNFIFIALAFLVGIYNENRIKGFGLAIVLWLFLALVYDGIFLVMLVTFKEYPLEKFALTASVFNPIDLSRILILLKLDVAALLGFTGAVFKKFLGTTLGMTISVGLLLLWTLVPVFFFLRKAERRDF